MSATIVETLDVSIYTTEGQSSPARTEASRENISVRLIYLGHEEFVWATKIDLTHS
jgi:hypothetical protein